MASGSSTFIPILAYGDSGGQTLSPAHFDINHPVAQRFSTASPSSASRSAPAAPCNLSPHSFQPQPDASSEAAGIKAPGNADINSSTFRSLNTTTATTSSSTAGVGGGAKPAPRQAPKRLTNLEMRSKAVFRALEKLLETGVESEAQLWSVARILSGDEYAQVAEERFLAGQCGNPLCLSPAPPSPSPTGGKYKIDVAQQLVYEKDNTPPFFCCAACESVVRSMCVRLGSHAAAQHRFELLMSQAQEKKQQEGQRGAAQQTGAAASAAGAEKGGGANGRAASGVVSAPVGTSDAPPPAISTDTSDAQATPKASQGNAVAGGGGKQSSGSSPSGNTSRSSSGVSRGRRECPKDEGAIRWAPGETPQQWKACSLQNVPAPTTAAPMAASGQRGGKPTTGTKGVLRKISQYAAGTAKTPIMLAEIKERDPSMVAADTARSLPPDTAAAAAGATPRRHASPAASSRSGPRAVEGYVPQASKSQFKQLQKRQGKGEEVSSRGGRLRVRFSDEEGGSLELPSVAELARAAAVDAALRNQVQPVVGHAEAASVAEEGGREEEAGPALPAQAPTGKPSPAPVPSSGSSMSESRSIAPVDAAGAAFPVSAVAPLLMFDIEDPQGPLEKAAGSGSAAGGSEGGEGAAGLAAHFGRLRVVEEGGASVSIVQQGQEALAVSRKRGRNPLTPYNQKPEGDQGGQGASVEETLSQQMQASMRRLFPRLSATLPAELDAELEAELASDGDESDDAGWTSSEDEGERMAPGGASSDEEDSSAPAPRASFRMSLPFFGILFTHLESWVTDATLDHLATPPGSTPSQEPHPLPASSPHSAQIERVLARFLAAALPAVISQLCISVPKSEVERALHDLLHTMRFSGPLPPFKASQWQLVAIILLKALSLERSPALRPAFESREGVHRLGKALAGLAFTIEEFYAVLELLCTVD